MASCLKGCPKEMGAVFPDFEWGDSWLPSAAPRRSQSVILIYKQFNPRNAAKWGAPSASCCNPGESSCRPRLLSCCCWVPLDSAPVGSALSCHSSGQPWSLWASSVPSLCTHEAGEGTRQGYTESQLSTRFLGWGDNSCFIQDLFSPVSQPSCLQPTFPAQLWLF